MDGLNELADRAGSLLSGAVPAAETALRDAVGAIYPDIRDSFDYDALTADFRIVLIIAAVLILVRLLYAVRRRKSRAPYVLGCLAVLLVFLVPSIQITRDLAHNERIYREAVRSLSENRYEEALVSFSSIQGYRDADEQAAFLYMKVYDSARREKEKGNQETALSYYQALGDYRDSAQEADGITEEMRSRKEYEQAEELLARGDYSGALAAFTALGSYGNASERAAGIRDDLIGSWPQLYRKLRSLSDQRRTECTLMFTEEMNISESDQRTELDHAMRANGIIDYRWRFYGDKGNLVDISGLAYEERFRICGTADETLAYISECADRGVPEFTVFFTPEYGELLLANDRYELERLLVRSRLVRPSGYSLTDAYFRLRYRNAEYYASGAVPGRQASTREEFLSLMKDLTDRDEAQYDILLTDELVALLSSPSEVFPDDSKLINEIKGDCGIYRTYGTFSGRFFSASITYYTGKKILRAYRTGKTGELGDMERKTLDRALAVAGQAYGSDLDKEKQIHDYLCRNVVYSADDTEGNADDCAVGALLNGMANCDGYADAFYLCGNLAGLDVRYIHGDGRESSSRDQGGHVWNLIRINGSWVSVDATWDDSGNTEEPSYAFYNIGSDEAARHYIWDRRAVPVRICESTSNDLRNPELSRMTVTSWDQVYRELRKASEERKSRITLTSPALDFSADYQRLYDLMISVGIVLKSSDNEPQHFVWQLRTNLAEISRIEYYDDFAVCDTLQDVENYLYSCRNRRSRQFRIYCSSDALYRQLSGDNFKKYKQLQSAAGCNGKFVYYEGIRMICVKDASW